MDCMGFPSFFKRIWRFISTADTVSWLWEKGIWLAGWSVVSAIISWLAQLAWPVIFLIALATPIFIVGVLACIAGASHWLKQWRRKRIAFQNNLDHSIAAQPKPQDIKPQYKDSKPTPSLAFSDDLASQQELKDWLKKYATEHARVNITFFRREHRKNAGKLAAVFDMAGWDANYNDCPQEGYLRNVFPEGVNVSGVNSYLVDAVCKGITQAGFNGCHTELGKLGIPKDNPKYPFAKQTISITIGYD